MGRVAEPQPSHPIPSWRPGVVYWRPTSDGREIGVYPQLFGAALLYRGPLDPDDPGFDESWRLDSVERAIEVASLWDGESNFPRQHLPPPPSGPGDHRISRTHKHIQVRGVKQEADTEQMGAWVPVASYKEVEVLHEHGHNLGRVLAVREDLVAMQIVSVEGVESMDDEGNPGLVIDSIHRTPMAPSITAGEGRVFANDKPLGIVKSISTARRTGNPEPNPRLLDY